MNESSFIQESVISTMIEQSTQKWQRRLTALSHEIHLDPETSGNEHRAAERVRNVLIEAGFSLGMTQPSLPTAFCAEFGTGQFVVVLCVEYDALPGIGHGCGHNVNAAAAVGAGIALASVADRLGLTVRVLGTPSEEADGGKVDLLAEGFFEGVAVALMAHASDNDSVGNRSLALGAWTMTFEGRSAHAAVAPDQGINALDAMIIAQTAVGLARQQLPHGIVVSSIITNGGEAPNVIPSGTSAMVEVRGPALEMVESAWTKVQNCFKAGALATGCILEITRAGNVFADLRQDAFLADAYASALRSRGRTVEISDAAVGSTDIGNVSHRVPTIHPMIGYDANGAPLHTKGFADAGTSPSADIAVVDAAYGLAMAASLAASDPETRNEMLKRSWGSE